MPLSSSQILRENTYDSLEVSGSRLSPGSEIETKLGTHPRRRIAVACGRCRKRKIKCSGDPGNGQGCTNCKTSNSNGPCQFLRVNSEETEWVKYPSRSSCWPWHYGMSSTPAGALSPMPGAIAAGLNHSVSVAPHYQSRHGSYSYYPQHSMSRNEYSGYEEDSSYFSVQSPPYMIPSQDHLSVTSVYASPDSPKAWSSQEAGSTYSSLGYPYVPSPLSHVSMTPNMPSLFPASSRTLPVPGSSRSHSIGATSTLTEFLAGTLESAHSYKSNSQWASESITSGSSNGSSRTLSVGTVSSGPTSSSKASSSGQDIGYGYIPISHSPSTAPVTSTTAYSPSDPLTVGSPSTTYGTCSSDLICTISGDSLLPSESSSSDIYAYSSRDITKRRTTTESTSGTLMSGQTYTRLPPAQPIDIPFDTLEPPSMLHSAMAHPPLVHRTSLSTLSNGGY